MKKLIIISLLALAGCSQKVGSGELDLGSLSEDITYHSQTESTQTAGSFNYVQMELKVDGTFTQSEAEWTSPAVGKKCSLSGTWTAPVTDPTSEVGNELVLNVTHVNGGALGTPVEKRYELKELTADTLKVVYNVGADEVDMTNVNYVTYPEYSSAATGSFMDDTFCNR
ncbi:hypothetical protein AZI87_16310 [Bdellovibrio bacteriovorus]|uniref:Lipoprotein n=1 Tax=Bdellovibrio bacteriovorus TaxID=959 RepID=A0A161QF97_BDEBC|nr:hypothetical protein [Bdellovibrio bacteriovorus]KYG63037.1 hypothetical protein AZI87_16310 [Bdellovibrio bacteriovorus]